MIQVKFMKPFYTKVTDHKLRLVFAYQYLEITKDNEIFHFIPIEGKEMIIDLNTMQVQNLSEVFVFQRGNRFIRMPLYQLLLVSNIHEHLTPTLDNITSNLQDHINISEDVKDPEVLAFIQGLEAANVDHLIDQALLARNESLFYELALKKNELNQEFAL